MIEEAVTESLSTAPARPDPVVGVLIVVHNRKADLLRLLASLFRSDYRSFDVLVLDDHSSEDLSEVGRDFPLEYIRLDENVGFVAGMSKGLRHLLQKERYSYLWVLDSDLEVAPDALRHLVAAMNKNDSIGVAGCVIFNTYHRNVVVESGANVNLRTGIVTAKNCNVANPWLEKFSEVDFIASGGGGSLLRAEALKAAGLHDERYHFLWEDTDYGLCLKQCGFRVVVVSDAIVYHPPFTEKRNPNIYAYYGVRNPLLTVAKYSSGPRMPMYLFVNLCRYLRIGLFMLFSGKKSFACLTLRAIYDYVTGRFGKADLEDIETPDPPTGKVELKGENQVVILGLGNRSVVQSAVEFVRNSTRSKIILVVQEYRRELLTNIAVDGIITFDDRVSHLFWEYVKTGTAILRGGRELINTDLTVVSPLCYFGIRTFNWDHATGGLYRARTDLLSVWKPVISILLGVIFALLLLPPVYLASLKHKAK